MNVLFELMELNAKFQREFDTHLLMKIEGDTLYVTAQSRMRMAQRLEHFTANINIEADCSELIEDLRLFVADVVEASNSECIDLIMRQLDYADHTALRYLITNDGFTEFRRRVKIKLGLQ